ncbi:MAG: ABC transporter substrate-binding protein [candidate division Zixibacteria bacterium]|nr:ABC transporter substrate-binding protein [candidate division Zixibacteria bacterium]
MTGLIGGLETRLRVGREYRGSAEVTGGADIREKKHRRAGLWLVWLGILWLFPPALVRAADPAIPGSGSVRIAVVKSLDLPEYNLAYDGFFHALIETGQQPATTLFTLGHSDSVDETVWRTVDASHPDLILALGSRAAREASVGEKTTPVVYSMVLAPTESGSAPLLPRSQKNLTGATLNIPLRAQLDEIVRAFPTLKNVGIISDPSRTRAVVGSARDLAQKRGITLHVAWVSTEQQVPDAVRALRDSIDVLWMIPDETVLTPRSSRYIIFELIKTGVPVIGLSAAYVKAGALMALDCDYTDIGRQSGELAVRILAGQLPGQLDRTAPRMYTRALNLKIRDHIRIPMDERVIQDSNIIIYFY